MRYILMMNTSRGSGGHEISGWSLEEFEAHMAHMYRLNQELTEAGELIAVEALAAPGQAKLVCGVMSIGSPEL
jgi:hypothetical protein